MQKALKLMNIQLPEVRTDVTGVTGLAILRAIVAGERRGDVLAKLRQPGCKRSEQEIIQALAGTWRDEHLFVLAQSLDLYDYYSAKITECDHRLDQQFSSMAPRFDVEGESPAPPKSRTKNGSKSKNRPSYNVRAHLVRILGLGIDLVDVVGISESLAQTIISEIGTDMSRFPTSKHFCSWLGLAPHNDISGGKVLRSRVRKVHNRAGQALRHAAQSCSRSDAHLSGGVHPRIDSRLRSEAPATGSQTLTEASQSSRLRTATAHRLTRGGSFSVTPQELPSLRTVSASSWQPVGAIQSEGQRRGHQVQRSIAMKRTPMGLAAGRANTTAPFTTIVSTNTRHTQWRHGQAASSQSARKT